MNPNPAARRVAVVSAVAAALLASGFAAAEHHRADLLNRQMSRLEMEGVSGLVAADTDPNTAAMDPAMPSPVATAPSASDEVDADRQSAADSDDSAVVKVRQAARDLVREKLPEAKQDGVFTLPISRGDNLYIAGVDASIENQHRTIDVLVRLYTRKNGGQYWRAESLGPDQAAAFLVKASGSADN